MNRKEKTIVITIFANIILVWLKFALASSSGSVALRASAWHSVGDVFVSLLVLIGFFIAGWETRRQLRAGTIENIISLVVSGLMVLAAFDIFRDISGVGNLPELSNLWPVTIAAFLTIGITYFIARYKEYVGRATGSLSLVASGYHSRMDLYASVLVVVGLLSAALGLPALDRVAGIIVVALIVLSSFEIAQSALGALRNKRTSGGHESHKINPLLSRRTSFALCTIAALFIGFSSIYSVPLGERAVVQRFGAVITVNDPGIHLRVPVIDRITKIPVDTIRTVQIPRSLALTGDTSLIETELSVQYTISAPEKFLLNSVNPEILLSRETEAAFRQAVAAESADALLSEKRGKILSATVVQVQKFIDEHNVGLSVKGVQLLSATPPSPVASAFLDVASARENKNTYISEARGYQNETVALARGDAEKRVAEAAGEKARRVNTARGEAEQFSKKFLAYRASPSVTRTRLYLEALETVLPGVQKYIIDPRVETENTELWFTPSSITN